jgi:hypothetical protein
MTGHYTYLAAKGPGPDLYYTVTGAWSADQAEALVFGSVQAANATGIIGLPVGYKPVLLPATVEVIPQPSPGYNPC